MARPLRLEFPGALYHVTARGNERKPIYRDEWDRRRFLERLARVARTYRLRLHAYVLMRNHYHLLVETREANLARAMRQLNGVYTQDFNRRHRRAGHLFQGRYKALLVEKDSYLLELSRYIHLNPVRVGEVAQPWAFPWSSAAAFVGKAPAHEGLVLETVLGHLGRRRSTAQRRYAEFLMDGIAKRGATPLTAVEGQLLLGQRRWVERQKRRLKGIPVAPEVTGQRQVRARPPLSVVITQVCRAAKVDKETLLRPRGARGTWARQVAMALAWEVCGLTQREVGRAFGVGPYAVGKAAARAAALTARNDRVGRTVRKLKSNVQM
jgi:REP element-mobilizing transposase RayT